MNRILLLSALLAGTLVLGCTSAPGGPPGTIDDSAARANLCGSGEASLANLATQLDTLDANADTTAVTTLIGTTMADLASVQVEAGQAAVRDAAVTALGALQTAIADPNTRAQAATQAAAALRAAQAEICT